MIDKIEKFIQNNRWKAQFFEAGNIDNDYISNLNYGFHTDVTPPQNSVKDYSNVLTENIIRTYQKSDISIQRKIDKEGKPIAKELKNR